MVGVEKEIASCLRFIQRRSVSGENEEDFPSAFAVVYTAHLWAPLSPRRVKKGVLFINHKKPLQLLT